MIENLSFLEGIRMALETCMGVKRGEEVLVVGDSNNLLIANSFASVAATLGTEVSLILMKPREVHGNEPPKAVASAMLGADVIMLPTSKSLSHTNAREAATKKGARIASMPGINKEILEGAMGADYAKIHERSRSLVEKVTQASTVLITTDKGMKLELNIKDRKGQEDSGILVKPGDWGNLPAGEIYCAPLENEAEGIAIIDTVMAGVGILSEPIQIKIHQGKAISIEGGLEAEKFRSILEGADTDAFKIGELGIGSNPGAKPMGNPLVDEKVMGTVHIAFGDNSHMGGKQTSKIHLDGIISYPNLYLDGELVIERGKWLI